MSDVQKSYILEDSHCLIERIADAMAALAPSNAEAVAIRGLLLCLFSSGPFSSGLNLHHSGEVDLPNAIADTPQIRAHTQSQGSLPNGLT